MRKELERMEQLGVISRVDEPTPWCAGLVVVPKKSGEVRLCIDLKPLNVAVLREVHPIPGVDETLAKLSELEYFPNSTERSALTNCHLVFLVLQNCSSDKSTVFWTVLTV